MAHWYTVDNESPLIAYSGVWDVVRADRMFEGSARSTAETGATATFRWKGRGIRVWMSAPGSNVNQVSSYLINGADVVERYLEIKDVPTYNYLNFEREGLSDEPHTITITQEGTRKSNRGGAAIQLDRIEVLTSDSDPNPAPIYPPGYSPPNAIQDPPASSTSPRRPPAGNAPPTDLSPPSSSSTPTNAIRRPQDDSASDTKVTSAEVVASTIVVTSGASTLAVVTTLGAAPQSSTGSENALGVPPAITKVIPSRVATITDSGGSVRTEFVEVGGHKAGPSTRLLAGVIVGVILLVIALIGMVLVLFRRQRQRAGAFGSGEEIRKAKPTEAEVVEAGEPPVFPRGDNPFSGANPFEPPDSDHDSFRTFPTTATFDSPEDAPPAYRMSQGSSVPPVTFSKEAPSLRRQ